jgi:diaminohydroxyphosphoribosylaminopyrimidine deaminase/5-amino-6-(5-phosphoribosylamino)uracil reductase
MTMSTNPMSRALELARSALGTTSPNPAVGAVIVRDSVVVGEGHTLPAGQHHAEIGALLQAGPAAHGATLFCTLEPCCHYGRTPPCTDAIISAGISHVVYAVRDPNPRVAGGGASALRSAGIAIEHQPNPDADELYEAFAKHITTGLPFVVAKFAMSLDGKIATRTGASQWITGPEARARVQQMRKELDGIMVGIGTTLTDDPQLTARDPDGNPWSSDLQPVRIVVDSHGRTPPDARMLRQPGRTIIATGGGLDPARTSPLEDAGAQVCEFPGPDGRVNLSALLEFLGGEGIVSVLVEGGGEVMGAMLDAGLIDKVNAFVAPMLIGGAGASSPIGGNGATVMADVWHLERARSEHIGPDWLITGYPTHGGV